MRDWVFKTLRALMIILFSGAIYEAFSLHNTKKYFAQHSRSRYATPAMVIVIVLHAVALGTWLPKPEDVPRPVRRWRWVKKTLLDLGLLSLGFGLSHVLDGSWTSFILILLMSTYGLLTVLLHVQAMELGVIDVISGLLAQVVVLARDQDMRVVSVIICVAYIFLRACVHYFADRAPAPAPAQAQAQQV